MFITKLLYSLFFIFSINVVVYGMEIGNEDRNCESEDSNEIPESVNHHSFKKEIYTQLSKVTIESISKHTKECHLKDLFHCMSCCEDFLKSGAGNKTDNNGRIIKNSMLVLACEYLVCEDAMASKNNILIHVDNVKEGVDSNKIIKLLRLLGAKLSGNDLMVADWRANILDVMLQCGADPNEVLDDKGNSFFHKFFWSCTEKAKTVYKIIDVLLKHGANPNLLNHDKVSPLGYALQYVNQQSYFNPNKGGEHNRKRLCTLIDLCDNYQLQDVHGNTLLDYANKNKNYHTDVIEYLQTKCVNQDQKN